MTESKLKNSLALLVLMIGAAACAPQAGAAQVPPLVSTAAQHDAPGVIVHMVEIVIGVLLIASLVNLGAQRLRIPYTVGLVLVGFGLTFIQQLPTFNITPELILTLLVPPLVYEAAFLLDFDDLRRELPLVTMLAVPGVILTTLLVGGMVSLGAGIGLPYALVFGALIAATDPVAVVSIFRSLGAPRRLQVLLEGESLLNDGTAIVLFNLMLAVALTGKFNLGQGIVQFILVSGGGILVGLAAGIVISALIGRINNALVETSLTTVLAYGSYILAEYVFGASGVLAVVAAGLVSGQNEPRGMSPTTRIVVFNFWEYAAFLANSFVFLIIGIRTDINILIQNVPAILWAILAVLVARAVTVFGLSWLRRDIPVNWKLILFWGGLRGAISLSLALSLTADIPNREQLQAMAFGVVLFTLIVEGLSMQWLIRKSNVVMLSPFHQEYDRRHARAIAMRAAQARLREMYDTGIVSSFTLQRLNTVIDKNLKDLIAQARLAMEAEPSLHQEELAEAWIETLRARRTALTDLLHNNIITEDVYGELVAEVDLLLTNPESGWAELSEAIDPSNPPETASPTNKPAES